MNHRQHRVLLVDDDNKKTVKGLQTLLSSQGYGCEIVSAWKEALLKIKRRTFDLVICAYRLEGKNGVMLLQKMLSVNPKLVGLILSSFSDIRVVSHDTHNIDAISYLVRPCRDDKLLHAVEEVISCGKKHQLRKASEKRSDDYSLDHKVYRQSAMNDLERIYPGITQGVWDGPFNPKMRS